MLAEEHCIARIEQIAPDVARNAFFLINTLLEPFVPPAGANV